MLRDVAALGWRIHLLTISAAFDASHSTSRNKTGGADHTKSSDRISSSTVVLMGVPRRDNSDTLVPTHVLAITGYEQLWECAKKIRTKSSRDANEVIFSVLDVKY